MNYILGPGDELQVSVYGCRNIMQSIPVSVEGKVSIQYVGEISVSGMSIEAATQNKRGYGQSI
jgi:protein involved in polysaccharide export with SLBB domain